MELEGRKILSYLLTEFIAFVMSQILGNSLAL